MRIVQSVLIVATFGLGVLCGRTRGLGPMEYALLAVGLGVGIPQLSRFQIVRKPDAP